VCNKVLHSLFVMDFFKDFGLDVGHPKVNPKYCSGVEVDTSLATYVVGIVLYFIVAWVSVVLFVIKKRKPKSNITGLSLAFYLCLILFLFARTLWVVFETVINIGEEPGSVIGAPESPISFSDESSSSSCVDEPVNGLDMFNKVFNRVCFCLFLYVFQLMLFYWMDTMHTTVNANFAQKALSGSDDFGFITPLGRKLFHIATAAVVVCVLMLGLVRVWIQSNIDECAPDHKAKDKMVHQMDEANNIIISVVFFIYGFFFLFYGTKLNCRVHKSTLTRKVHGACMAEVFSIMLCAFFILRCFMFIWAAAGGCYFNGNVFNIFTYYVPEIGAVVFILLSLNSNMFNPNGSDDAKPLEDDHFTDPLDREIEENELKLAGTMD